MALRRAADLAGEVADVDTAVEALTELGYVDALAGRRLQAHEDLQRARDLAAHDDRTLPRILGVGALNLADWGRREEAIAQFHEAVARAESADQPRALAFALTLGARTLSTGGDHAEAARWLARALDVIAEERWLSFRPLALCFRHELDLERGREPAQVRTEVEQTFSQSCQLGDPCWEGLAARVLGITWAGGGPTGKAYDWFAEARSRAARVNDTWSWVRAAVLESEIDLARTLGDEDRVGSAAPPAARPRRRPPAPHQRRSGRRGAAPAGRRAGRRRCWVGSWSVSRSRGGRRR